MSVSGLLELIHQCHVNNSRLGLTGLLIYGNGTFLQTIEGEDEAVKGLVDKISRDQRHRGFKVLQKSITSDRQYADWSMRLERLTEESLRKVPGLRDFAFKKFNRDYLSTHIDVAENLIDSYRSPIENSTLERDSRDKQLVELRRALDACRQRQQMASLLIESLVETGKHNRIDDAQIRLCKSMLQSMSTYSKPKPRLKAK